MLDRLGDAIVPMGYSEAECQCCGFQWLATHPLDCAVLQCPCCRMRDSLRFNLGSGYGTKGVDTSARGRQ